MSIDEIANELNQLAYRLDSMRNYQATTEGLKTTKALREAAAMLQSNHNGKTNAPLTLDELREMDGEPVWIEIIIETVEQKGGWAICYFDSVSVAANQRWTTWTLWYEDYGKIWLAYRRKPEEGTK